MQLDPKRLVVLGEIADRGGISAAARALGHTSSAVSQQLTRLEQEVGVPLVDRTANGADLTATGKLLAAYGRRIGLLLEDAAGELAARDSQVAGPISIGVPAPAITFFAGTALSVLAERAPQIRPRLVEAGAEEGLRALRRGELDLLIVEDDAESPTPLPAGVRATVLAQDGYQVVLPEDWPVPEDPAELSGRPWIGAPAGSPRDLAFQRLAARHDIEPSLVHEAGHRFAVYTMLAVRLGAVILPSNAAVFITHGTVTDLPVPGTHLLRLLRRTGPAAPVPAAEAAAQALQVALLMAVESVSVTGMAEVEPRVTARLRDPSDPLDPSDPSDPSDPLEP